MVAQRCPRCHRPSEPARPCRCDQAPSHGIERSEAGGGDPDGLAGGAGGRAPRGIERLRAALHAQQASAWLELALLLVLDAAASSGFVYAALHGFIVFSALGCTSLILLTAREVQRVRAARARLRHLARRHTALPRAVVHRR